MNSYHYSVLCGGVIVLALLMWCISYDSKRRSRLKMEKGQYDIKYKAKIVGRVGVACWEFQPTSFDFKSLQNSNFFLYGCDEEGKPVLDAKRIDHFRTESGTRPFFHIRVLELVQEYDYLQTEKRRSQAFAQALLEKQQTEVSTLLGR